jgi:hypothetical protein
MSTTGRGVTNLLPNSVGNTRKIPRAHSVVGRYVSVSGGAAALLRKIDITAQELIAGTDQTPYQVKYLGRNRMVSVQAEPRYVHV